MHFNDCNGNVSRMLYATVHGMSVWNLIFCLEKWKLCVGEREINTEVILSLETNLFLNYQITLLYTGLVFLRRLHFSCLYLYGVAIVSF